MFNTQFFQCVCPGITGQCRSLCRCLPVLTIQNLKIKTRGRGQNSVFLAKCESQCFHLYACKLKLDLLQKAELIHSFGVSIKGLSELESGLRHGCFCLQLTFFQERRNRYLLVPCDCAFSTECSFGCF